MALGVGNTPKAEITDKKCKLRIHIWIIYIYIYKASCDENLEIWGN